MRLATTLCLVLLGAAACGGGTDSGTGDDAAGGGGGEDTPVGAWVLTSAEPAIDVPDATRITLTVEEVDGQLRAGGTAACNQYGGTLRLEGDAWVTGELARTEMGCEPAIMEAEATYLEAITAVDTWTRDGDTLELTGGHADGGAGVRLGFERLPEVEPTSLTGTTWEVDGYVRGTGEDAAVSSGVAGVEPAALRLEDDGTFTLFTGCRDFTGEWTTAGDEVVLPSWGQAEDSRGVDARGDLTCGEQAEAQERDVLAVVEGGFTAELDGQQLVLTNGDVGLTLRATD